MDKKIGSFILAIVFTLISGFLIYICYQLNLSLIAEGWAKLSYIVTIPLYFVFYALLFGLTTASLISSIKAISSSSKFIKITSIILLILSIAILTLAVLLAINLFKKI